MDESTFYTVDPSHPIPNVDVIDVDAVRHDGGSEMIIVIATPLKGDDRSLYRLRRKIERYLQFTLTKEFKAEKRVARPEITRIVVRIHPESDGAAFKLLELSEPWVRSNNVDLVVDTHLPSLH